MTGFWCEMTHARTELSKVVVDFSATSSPRSANTLIAIADTTAINVQNVITFPNQSRTRLVLAGSGRGGDVKVLSTASLRGGVDDRPQLPFRALPGSSAQVVHVLAGACKRQKTETPAPRNPR